MPNQLIHIQEQPGHLIRRLQQIAVAIFFQETEGLNITPVQFAILNSIFKAPSIDQKTLSGEVGQDTSTVASTLDRLESRGLVQRNHSQEDRRAYQLTLTPEGEQLLTEIIPKVLDAQVKILDPLAPHEQQEFMRLMQVLVDANNELSRAPIHA